MRGALQLLEGISSVQGLYMEDPRSVWSDGENETTLACGYRPS